MFLTDERFTREEALVHWSETQPWNTFRLSMTKLLPLTPHIAVITYRVVATRDRVLEPYRARCTSVHPLHEDIWKLPFREQIALPPLLRRLAIPASPTATRTAGPAQHHHHAGNDVREDSHRLAFRSSLRHGRDREA